MKELQLEMEDTKDDTGCPICKGNLEYNDLFKKWLCVNKYCTFKGYKSIIRDPWSNVKEW